jgi:predicted secreted protein
MKKTISVLLACALLGSAALAEPSPAASVDITLTENATTGYLWSYAVSDEAVLTVTDAGQTAGDEALVGAPGTHSWRIAGAAAGSATVAFTYSQPWEGGGIGDAFTYSFTVDENLNVTLTNARGIPETSIPDLVILSQYEDPAAGPGWSYEASAQGVLQPAWEITLDFTGPEKPDGSPDAGGIHGWAFRAVGEGDVTLTFTYPGSQEGAEPEATAIYGFTVGADMAITPTAAEGDCDFRPETMRGGE